MVNAALNRCAPSMPGPGSTAPIPQPEGGLRDACLSCLSCLRSRVSAAAKAGATRIQVASARPQGRAGAEPPGSETVGGGEGGRTPAVSPAAGGSASAACAGRARACGGAGARSPSGTGAGAGAGRGGPRRNTNRSSGRAFWLKATSGGPGTGSSDRGAVPQARNGHASACPAPPAPVTGSRLMRVRHPVAGIPQQQRNAGASVRVPARPGFL